MSHGSGGGRRRKGGVHHEEHENHERWLVTYADMITLLMVLFIVLFAMSSLDSKKFAQLASGLAASFGVNNIAFTGKISPMDNQVNTAVLPLDPGVQPNLSRAVSQTPVKEASTAEAAIAASDRARASNDADLARHEVRSLRDVQRQIEEALRRKHLEDTVRFHFDERGLVVTVVTSAVVFDGDKAELLTVGRRIMDAISPALRKLPNGLQIDGHTNQLPVPTVNYPSAWELSTARASAVARYLTGHGISPTRLTASGYADTRPLVDPKDPRSVTMNRRVDIVVMSTLPPAQRALLPSAAG
jgi:chemotaxis protein MotB